MVTKIKYKDLKSNIIKACTQMSKDSMQFSIDLAKLTDLVEDMSLIPLNTGISSTQVTEDKIPFLCEYFSGAQLSWISKEKFLATLIFIDSTSINTKAMDLINRLNSQELDSDIDRTNIIATLVAEYPCYFSNIVSYQNNNPKYAGKPSYEIVCRANKVVIKDTAYGYNPKDF